MKKIFGAATMAGALLIGLPAVAQVNIQDFEAGTSGAALPGAWAPTFSGTSSGNLVAGAGNSGAVYSDEQKVGGLLSGKLNWTWLATSTNPPKRIRIQPAAGWIVANNATVDRTSTPFVGFYVFGAAQGDQIALYMGEGAGGSGASPYEQFAPTDITFNGWQLYERNILSSPVTGLFTGNGTLAASNSVSGLMFYPPTAVPETAAAVTYYVDDFAYTAASRTTSVDNWSAY